MKSSYMLLFSSLLLITLLIGSVSANSCPEIPSPPYIPKSPQEDIIKVEAYVDQVTTTTLATTTVAQPLRPVINGHILHLTVTFAQATPADEAILILVTMLMGNPPTEEVLDCAVIYGPSSTTQILDFPVPLNGEAHSIAVYATITLNLTTDRAPNDGFYQITSLSASDPNVFQDYDATSVGGITTPINRLEVLAPYLALAGLIAAVSTVYVIKKRKD